MSTPITVIDESSSSPSSRQLVDGTGTVIDTSTPSQIKVNVTSATAPIALTIGTYSGGSAFSPAANTFTNVTSATQINLPATASVPAGTVIGLTIGSSQGATVIKTDAGANDENIVFNGSSTNNSITIQNGDEIFLTNRGSGTWLVTSFLPQGGSSGSTWSVLQGGTGASSAAGALTNLGALSNSLLSSKILVGNASNLAAAVSVSGDASLSNSGALTVSKTNGTSFAPSATTDTTNASNISSGTLAVANGGTGATSLTPNGVLLSNGSGNAVSALANNTQGYVLTANSSGAPSWQAPTGGGGSTGQNTISVSVVQAPAAPTVTVTGSAGSSVYEYAVVARDAGGNSSAAGLATLINNGNSTLSGSNYNAISWSAVSGASSYDIYRIAGPSNVGKLTNTSSTSYNDQSNSNGDGTIPPSVAMNTSSLSSSSQITQMLDCSNGNIVVNLPDATASGNNGREFLFKRVDSSSHVATINGYGSQIVAEKLKSYNLYNQANSLFIQSDGSSSWKNLAEPSGAGWYVAALPKKAARACSDWGTHNMLAIGNDGQIYGWGLATNGNLSGGITSGSEIARPVALDPNNPPASGTSIADWCATGSNLFVVLSDGTVYGAGLNTTGQLGLGTTANSSYLQKITFFNGMTVVKVWAFDIGSAGAGSYSRSFFMTNTGALYACGYNATGELGIGNTSSPIKTPTLVSGVYNPVQIKSTFTLGGSYSLLCDAAGSLYVTGVNGSGQLGTGNTTQLNAFTKVTISGAAPIANVFPFGSNTSGAAYAAVLDNAGTLYMAGTNTYGQLGQGHANANSSYGWFKLASTAAYNTGTVSASGTSVTGSGTSWTTIPANASSLRIGFGSNNPGSISTWYSIASIGSNTSITLSSSAGTIGAGTAYVITATPLPNPAVDFVWTGSGTAVGCAALDNSNKLFTWGYNGLNNLFYSNSTATQAAPTSNVSNAQLVGTVTTNGSNAYANLVFWDGSKLHISGSTLDGFIGVTDSSFASGSTAVSLPDSIASGAEKITDIFVNSSGASGRLFILTDHGCVYSNGDNTNGVSTGGVSAATSVGIYKIRI